MRWSLSIGLLVLAAGCADHDGRVEVLGTVSYRGEPLAEGRILFRPAPETQGPVAAGTISHGSYRIPARRGPGTGRYTITIMPGNPGPPPKEFLKLDDVQHPASPRPSHDFQHRIQRGRNVLDFELPTSDP